MNEKELSQEPGGALDGAWFRRERERIAVGRRAIAARLEIPESRLATVENKHQPVPAAWLPVIAQLGFRVPQAESGASPRSEQTAVVTAPAVTAPAEVKQEREQPAVSRAPEVAPVSTPSAPAAKVAAATPPPTALTGAWLRGHRQQLRFYIRYLCERLRVTPQELTTIETKNAPVPSEWLPELKKLGFPIPPELLPED